MANFTPNANLEKPLGSEHYLIPKFNANMDKIDAKFGEVASKDSPEFTGVPIAPTALTGTNTNQIATTAFVKAVLDALVDSSPTTLDTLNELAAALGDDPNFATSIATELGLKAPKLNPTFTGIIKNGSDNNLINRDGLDGEVTIKSSGVEIGKQNGKSIASTSFIDFHSSVNNVDYDARIACNGGTSTNGTGGLEYLAVNHIFKGIMQYNQGALRAFNTSFIGSGGTGIFANPFGVNVPIYGFLMVWEFSTNNFYFGYLDKQSDASAVGHRPIVSNGLSVLATNASGTVAITGFTNTANVVMKSFIYQMGA